MNPLPKAPIRLLHLTDVHFGGEDAPAAQAALEFAQGWPCDLVVVSGDVTLNGLPREFEAARRWLDALPTPRLVTPGNHDTPYWNLPLRAFTPFARYRRWIGKLEDCGFDSPSLAVRMINTARGFQPRPDWSKGAINLDLCRDAARELEAAAPQGLRVVSCHHPLIEAIGAPVTGGVHRGDEAARLLSAGNVDLILTGHVHVPFAVPLTGGDGLTYAVGAGTLSTRLRGTPPSFSTIEAQGDCVTVTAQGFEDGAFKPWRTWRLPRRPQASAGLSADVRR